MTKLNDLIGHLDNNKMKLLVEGIQEVKKYYPDIPDDKFIQLIKLDPTYKGDDRLGKAGKWILNLYKNKLLKDEDFYKVTDYLTTFFNHFRELPQEQRDIGRYKSLGELANIVANYENKEVIPTNRQLEKKAKSEAEKVYEDDKWLVIVPKTMKASQYYGANTKWCTAAKDENNAFDDYNDMDNLYININKKTGKKYQFHFYTGQFMDELDYPLDNNSFLSEGLKQWYFDNKILEWLPPYYTDVHTYTYGYDFGSPRVFLEIDLEEMCQSLFDYCYSEESYIILNKNMNNNLFLTGQFFNQLLRGFNTSGDYDQLLSDFIHIFEDELKSGLKEDDVYDLIIHNEDIKTKIREYIRDNVFDKAIKIMQKQIPVFDYNDIEENYDYLWQYDLDLDGYREECADFWFSENEFPFAVDEEDSPNCSYHDNPSYWYLYIESNFNHEEIATDVLALAKEVCNNLYSIIYNDIVSGGSSQLSFNYEDEKQKSLFNEALNEEKAVVTNKTNNEIELNNSTVLHKNVVNQFLGYKAFNNLQVGQEVEIGDYHEPTSENIKDYKLNDNFWKWFGNSKVVDEEGKPIICYHGGPEAIKAFDKRYSGNNTANNETEVFFFTSDEGVAEDYSVEAQARIGDNGMWNNGLEMDYSYDDYMEQIRDMARRNVHTNPCFISMENPIIWDNNYNDYSYKLIYTLTSIAQGKWDYNSDYWDLRVEEEILDRYTTTNEDGDTDYSELENTTFDGVIIKNIHDSISNEGSSNVFTTEYLVWNPNQIKSVYNKGIWNLYNNDVMENTTLTEDLNSTVLKRRKMPTFVNRTEEQTREGLEKILNKTQYGVFFDYYDNGYSLEDLVKKYNIEPEKIKQFIVILRKKISKYDPDKPQNPNIDPTTGQFKKGATAWNKGKYGFMGANKTSFTKADVKPAAIGVPKQGHGHMVTASEETRPTKSVNGKVYNNHKRVSYPRWLLKQNGIDVPADCVVWHKDGDYTNNDLSNLEVITRREACLRTLENRKK